MKKRIITALFLLLLISASGVVLATNFINTTTRTLSGIVTLHQIEDLRQHMIISIQTVQSDLYTVNTMLGKKVDTIADHVIQLQVSARQCTGCHHEPQITQELEELNSLIVDFQEALSYYITASANRQRIERLKLDAASIGNKILRKTEIMSLQASKKLEEATTYSLAKIDQAKNILYVTIGLTFIFGGIIAFYLIQSVTKPIKQLVTATRAIASGDLDHTVCTNDKTEFGELAEHFNSMSNTIKVNYEDLLKEMEERILAEEALRESEERYALAARGANDGLWDIDLRRDVVYYSSRWKAMLGFDDDDIDSSLDEWLGRVHELDWAKVEKNLTAHINGNIPHFECEYRIHKKDNSIIWVLSRGLAVRDGNGIAYRLAGSQTDITARKKAEEQLVHDAFHDPLTELPNRALFLNRLGQVMKSAERNSEQFFAVLFTDLDRFKIINDCLGHDVGDNLLVEMGKRINVCLRPGDTVARFGGDEFAVLLEDISNKEDIEEIVRRIETEVVKPFHIQGHELFTSHSIGIATQSERYKTPEEMIRDADIAMYQAKADGGSRHVYFDSIMHATVIARNQLERDLRSAVERQEDFILHYQPIMNLKKHAIEGFEALIRWKHESGLIQPDEFIPLAEETGLIIPISKWVIREACRQLRIWQEQLLTPNPLKMSVNISSKTLLRDNFVESVAACLQEENLDPESLVIEITENVILEHSYLALDTLLALKSMGVNIHIDDFGTGYSSLSYLPTFPVNALKIDRSFTSVMSAKRDNLEIVKTIIALAHNLDLEVVAEGVEQAHQLSTITDLQCAYGQGFFFSKALKAEAVPAWIKANRYLN